MNEIVRYVIGGVTSSVGEYLSYLLVLKVLKFSPYIGVIIGFVVSTLISFGFNEFIVFKKKPGETRNRWHALMKNFMTYLSTGIFLKEFLMYLFIDKAHFSPTYAPIIILIIIAPLNYLIAKLWAFKTHAN